MEKREYRRMSDFEKDYWWHKGKLHLLRSLKEKYFPQTQKLKILEIGCGSGENINLLSEWGDVLGVDYSSEAVKLCRQKGIKNVLQGEFEMIESECMGYNYDLIVALDVLEHIQEDTYVLKKIHQMLKENGLLIVSVPAYKILWSTHDEALHHKRRYHSIELKQKLLDTGYEIDKLSHFVFFMFLPITILRIVSNFYRRSPYPKTSYILLPELLNNFLTDLLKFESHIINKFSLPVGTTLLTVARKVK